MTRTTITRTIDAPIATVFDTVFTTREVDGQAELTMVMEANAHKLLPRLLNPLIKGMIQKLIEKDMDAVKAYCEARSDSV